MRGTETLNRASESIARSTRVAVETGTLIEHIHVDSGLACGIKFCSWATKNSYFFHTNNMLGILDFTSSEHWASFN